MDKKNTRNETYDKAEALRDLPGASIDYADDVKATDAEEKERTKTLNNNPRNNDLKMP